MKSLLAFALFIVGFLIWTLDARQIYCSDIALLNGRAIFHYINAVVMYVLFEFYSGQDAEAN